MLLFALGAAAALIMVGCLVLAVGYAHAQDPEEKETPGLVSWERCYPTLGLAYRWTALEELEGWGSPVITPALKYALNRQLALRYEMRILTARPRGWENEIGVTLNLRGIF